MSLRRYSSLLSLGVAWASYGLLVLGELLLVLLAKASYILVATIMGFLC